MSNAEENSELSRCGSLPGILQNTNMKLCRRSFPDVPVRAWQFWKPSLSKHEILKSGQWGQKSQIPEL